MNMTFETWEARTRIALAMKDINHLTADPLIEDARVHWETSGQEPLAALGTPEDFAVAAAAEQPAGVKAGRDREGNAPGEYLSGVIFVLAVMTIPWSLVLGLVLGGFSFSLTPARLVGGALFTLVALCLYALPHSLRAAGRPRIAPWAYVPTLALMALTAVAFTALPHTHLVTIPVLVLDAAALFVAWLTIRPAKASDPPPAPPAAGPQDSQLWLARLEGLLIGRHDLPPARARELVAEARGHLGTGSAATEFGPIEIYAADLAEHESVRHVPWWHQQATRNLLLLGFVAVLGRTEIAERLEVEQIWGTLSVSGLVITGLVALVLFLARRVAAGRQETKPPTDEPFRA